MKQAFNSIEVWGLLIGKNKIPKCMLVLGKTHIPKLHSSETFSHEGFIFEAAE